MAVRQVLQIGEAFGPEEYTFSGQIEVVPRADGWIYVLDEVAHEIRLYDASGRFRDAFGRTGSGPGEMSGPVGLTLAGSVLQLIDHRLQRRTVFSASGDVLETHPLPRWEGVQQLVSWWPLRSGFYLAATAGHYSPIEHLHDPWRAWILGRAGQGAKLDTLAHFRMRGAWGTWMDQGRPRSNLAGEETGDGGAVAVHGDSLIAVVDGGTGGIRYFVVDSAGPRLRSVAETGIAGRPVTRADTRAFERDLRGRSLAYLRRPIPATARIAWDAPEYFSAATEAVFSDDASLWVRHGGGVIPGNAWTVLDPTGVPRFRVRFPARYRVHAIRGDRIYGAWRDSLDVKYVRVYGICTGGAAC